jgi:biofilm PGA synthesis N-glycosyltransferase PgaC
MTATIIFSLLILVLYVLKIQRYKYKWKNYPEFSPEKTDATLGISVVIAFRNEALHLETLLLSLKNQVYPTSLYEIILVNDHSDDTSEVLAMNFCRLNPNFHLMLNSVKTGGKKSALMTGIHTASHELIITTDADCFMDKYWLATIARFYEEQHPDMIIGLVDITSGSRFFEKFQEVEFLSLIAAGAGAAADQKPIYCNAACFAFKKSLYASMFDPLRAEIISGDDTLFLHAVKKIPGKNIRLLKSSQAIVFTQGHSQWSEYFGQRKRWISKSRYYHDPDALSTAILVLLVNLCFMAAMGILISGLNYWLFPLLFLVKTFIDYYFLKGFMRFFDKKLLILEFMAYSILYPFYVTIIAVAGLGQGYTWKGRHY